MIEGKTVLGIIPARGGSKGLINKNVLPLMGEPLISWTINAALGSEYLDRCIVSTDSVKISEIAIRYGCEVPFIRPDHLATDEAKTIDVIVHAISSLMEDYDIVLLLQPTSPLRTSGDIDRSLEMMIQHKTESLVSVVKSDHPPEWSFRIIHSKITEFLQEAKKNKRRQEYAQAYSLNGAIYACFKDLFLNKKTLFYKDTLAFVMPKSRSVDIDSADDLNYCEFLLRSHIS
jgi:CMP-N,N'-diacetyllegionaminic acid synthase